MFREDKTAALIHITIENENNEVFTDALQGILLKKNKFQDFIWVVELCFMIFVFN